MPSRPSHIPHATERSALQKMSPKRGLRPEQLHPAGPKIIAGMLRKGWIEKQQDGRTYCITPAGETALRAVIPAWTAPSAVPERLMPIHASFGMPPGDMAGAA